MQKYLLIAAGGALGSILRYWVGSTISGRMGTRFPYGTLVINITACVILGFTLTYFGKRADLSSAWRFFLPIGFIGAYSTFSTYEWETFRRCALARFCWRHSMRWAVWCLGWQPPGAEQRSPIFCKETLHDQPAQERPRKSRIQSSQAEGGCNFPPKVLQSFVGRSQASESDGIAPGSC